MTAANQCKKSGTVFAPGSYTSCSDWPFWHESRFAPNEISGYLPEPAMAELMDNVHPYYGDSYVLLHELAT